MEHLRQIYLGNKKIRPINLSWEEWEAFQITLSEKLKIRACSVLNDSREIMIHWHVIFFWIYWTLQARIEFNLRKILQKNEGAISTSATPQFEKWPYFHFSFASKQEAQFLSLEMRYSKNFNNGNFLHPITQLLILHNISQKSAHQVKKLGFRMPQKNLFFCFFSPFSIANIKSCQ